MAKTNEAPVPYRGEFSPVDAVSALLLGRHAVETAEEFEGLIIWLGRKANEPLRKRAYEAIASEATGRTLLEAKALLLDKTCGAYVKKLLNAANGDAAWGLSSDINDAQKDRMDAQIAPAEEALNKFCHVIKPELFTGQLRKAAMTRTAADRLLASFDGRADMAKSIATLLAVNVKELGEQAQAELPGLVRAYFESSQRRGEIKRCGDGEAPDEAFEMLGLFAPLIRFIEDERNPKIKMEMAAHFEDYVRSGWFARDHIDESTGPGCQEGAWWGAGHESAPEFREILKKLGNGDDVKSSVVRDAFALRVSELALAVMCKTEQVRGEAPNKHEVARAGRLDPHVLFKTTAGAGQPDTFWISPDSARVLMTCATADETMARQDNQIVRYVKSILGAIEKRMLGNFDIPPGAAMQVEARSFSVSFGQKKSAKPGPQAGSSLLQCFNCGSEENKDRLIAAFNTVPFLAMLASDPKDLTPDIAANLTLDLAGAREEVWSKSTERAPWISTSTPAAQQEHVRKAGLESMSKALAAVGKALGAVEIKDNWNYNRHVGGIGTKAYDGLYGVQEYALRVMELHKKATPLERVAMDKHLLPQAASLSTFFTALAAACDAGTPNVRNIDYIINQMNALSNQDCPESGKKESKKKSKSP